MVQSDSIEETNLRTRLRHAAVIYNSFALSHVGYLDPAPPAPIDSKPSFASNLLQAATRPELQSCLDLWAPSVGLDVLTGFVEQAISDFVRGVDTAAAPLIFDTPSYFDRGRLRRGERDTGAQSINESINEPTAELVGIGKENKNKNH